FLFFILFFFFSSRRRHTRSKRDWSSDVCSSDLALFVATLATLATLFAIFAVSNIPITRARLEDYGITYDQIKTIVNWMLPILVIILANWSLCAYMFLVKTKKSK